MSDCVDSVWHRTKVLYSSAFDPEYVFCVWARTNLDRRDAIYHDRWPWVLRAEELWKGLLLSWAKEPAAGSRGSLGENRYMG